MKRPILPLSLLLVCLPAVFACSRYTAPSPLDGRWQVVAAEGGDPSAYPFSAEETVYWDFLNVLYKVGVHEGSHTPLRTREWGNAYFRRDSLLLVRGEPYLGKALTPPFPCPFTRDTLCVRYRLRGRELVLTGAGYSIRLRRH